MRTLPLLLSFFFFFFTVRAQQTQPVNNLLLGYQEFPTTITSHAADGEGNQYYTGTFRGQLTVNKKVLASGNGLEDLFWVKTNAAGQVIRYKIFGSPYSEISYINSMALGNNRMLFGGYSMAPVTFDNITVNPYPATMGVGTAASLVCTDTAGKVLWAKRTNLQNFKVYHANNVFHVMGIVPSPVFPAIKVEDDVVLDSIGRSALVHLMFDESGKFLSAKSISARRAGQSISSLNVSFFSDKSLMVQFGVNADSSFYLNNNVVPLPTAHSFYHLLIKTDTAYKNYKTKLLNPQRQNIAGVGSTMLPVCVSPKDSVYAVMTYENFAAPLTLDGLMVPSQSNTLLVFDSTLTARRQVQLGTSVAGSYPSNTYKRRIYFRNILFQNGNLYLNGVYTGINESPMNTIKQKDTAVKALPGIALTIDQNGPSRSFMASISANVSHANMIPATMQWYGYHSEYENLQVTPAFLHAAGLNRLAFTQAADNTWNPWIMDNNLTIVSGTMTKNADMPEVPQMVQYFDDGSRLVMGYARGKTAFDGAGSSFISNPGRRDIFLVRIRPNNQIAWYKRFHSTLVGSEIRGLNIKNGKAYFLVNYMGTQNDSNFIKVDTELYSVGVNASLLANIDSAGSIKVMNLTNQMLRSAFLRHFSFFSNGDLALVTAGSNLPEAGFANGSFGIYLFRCNSTTGAIVDKRKISSSYLLTAINTLQVDKSDQLYLAGGEGFSNIPYTLYLHNATGVMDSLKVTPNNNPQQYVLLQTDMNRLKWLKRSSGSGYSSGRSLGNLFIVNNKPVVAIMAAANNQPVYWDGKLLHNGFDVPSFTFAELDVNGVMQQSKVLRGFSPQFARTGTGNRLYVSGMITKAMQIDTIQINFAGGTVDGLGLVLDSNYVAKKSFRVASPYAETMLDMDVYQDTTVALAYTAQGNPQVYLNRTAAVIGDYEEDAYVGIITTRNNVVTGLNDPLPPSTQVSVTPNPVTNQQLGLSVQVTEPLHSVCTVYGSNGQSVASTILRFTTGTNRYTIPLPEAVGKGVYHVVIRNKRWTTTKTFMVL